MRYLIIQRIGAMSQASYYKGKLKKLQNPNFTKETRAMIRNINISKDMYEDTQHYPKI